MVWCDLTEYLEVLLGRKCSYLMLSGFLLPTEPFHIKNKQFCTRFFKSFQRLCESLELLVQTEH